MQKVYFYIGANNATHVLETEKIVQAVNKHFAEFTAYEVIGYWKGTQEKSLKVEILTEELPAKIAKIAKELRALLQQDAIGLEIVETNFALVQ
jgi:NAD(P)H-flavin reductase